MAERRRPRDGRVTDRRTARAEAAVINQWLQEQTVKPRTPATS